MSTLQELQVTKLILQLNIAAKNEKKQICAIWFYLINRIFKNYFFRQNIQKRKFKC